MGVKMMREVNQLKKKKTLSVETKLNPIIQKELKPQCSAHIQNHQDS